GGEEQRRTSRLRGRNPSAAADLHRLPAASAAQLAHRSIHPGFRQASALYREGRARGPETRPDSEPHELPDAHGQANRLRQADSVSEDHPDSSDVPDAEPDQVTK